MFQFVQDLCIKSPSSGLLRPDTWKLLEPGVTLKIRVDYVIKCIDTVKI